MSVFLPKRLSASPDQVSAAPGAGLHLTPIVFQPARLKRSLAATYILQAASRL
jgi:hypothetical protein